jgi:hypothetical protein
MPRSMSLFALTVLMSGFIAVGCTNIRVQSDYDPEAPFSGLETYAWSPDTGTKSDDPRIDNSLMDDRIRAAVDRELAASGFEPASDRAPDFLMTYHASLRTKLESVTTAAGYRGSYGYGAWGGYAQTLPAEYEEGTLILDVIDPEANRLIWRGTAQARAHRGDATPEERSERINAVVAKILAQFPPK